MNNTDNLLLSVLQKFQRISPITIDQLSCTFDLSQDSCADIVLYLKKAGYLKIEQNYANLNDMTQDSLIGYQTPMVISFEGRIAVAQELRTRKKLFLEEIRAWATLAIAFAALLVSIAAVIKGI